MTKKVVLAIDSFKGSASSIDIAAAVQEGIETVVPEVDFTTIPIADGGEGTVDAIVIARKGEYHTSQVKGPLGDPVDAKYGMIDGDIAIIEMSAASGITLVPKEKLNPLKASTFGTGQLVLDAIDNGAREIYMGIGGSATNDGGMGLACAWGVRFLDEDGQELPPAAESLGRLARIDASQMDERIKSVKFTILCDVNNPLCGPQGASYIFGGQKGANEEMKAQLDGYLHHYADCLLRDLGADVLEVPGAGAAGGLGAGMMAFAKAHKKSGIEAVMELIQLDEHLKGADLVITGEGRMDNQTAFGKAPIGVALAAQAYNIPVIAVVGGVALETETVYEKGISLVLDIINEPMQLEYAMEQVIPLAAGAGRSIGRIMKLAAIS
ncbi:glycerate kinase [uncultured Veillonella sp.]|uniref:glycerate kinase n=1 Tax=uncultured Veillonella sp. TaxID=159268 RepID=UPI0025E4951C|nr:glycerate kinase [uncultured Veillonella sp.]MDY3974199.1 glycerate kinase [Veillonella caviae]